MTDNDLVARLRDQQDMIQLGEDAYEAADAIERLKELADKFMWQVRDTCARAEAAEARIAKLEAALKPFAAMPCGICENDDPAIGVERCSDDTPVYVTRHDHGGQTVTAGHFRAARAALEDKP
jgi:hypothetical protein